LKLEGISEDEIESTAEKYGKTLADRISVLAGHYVHAHLKGYNQVMNDGTERVVSKHTAKYNIHVSIKLDLQSQEISKAIKECDTSILNERYHYAALGLKAEAYEIYDMMFIAFFQSIHGISELADDVNHFEPLRNALSHIGKLHKEETINPLKNIFGETYFDFTFNDTFDRNSKKNIDNVKIEALKIKAIAMKYFSL
jgi:hypothetical protein